MKTFSPIESVKSFSPVDDEEESVVPTTKTFSPVEKRESQHLKQAAAGVLDIGAGLPALAGLIATPFKAGYHAIADDTGLKESFVKGLDNPAMRLSGEMHEGINNMLDIEDPEGLEQLSRLAPMLIPTPASLSGLVTKGAGAASKALNITSSAGQKAMEFGAQMVVPMVQTTKGASLGMKAAQVGLQDAITIGADQGIRHLTDSPTIASSFSAIDDSLIKNPEKTALGVLAVGALGFLANGAMSQRANALKALAAKSNELGAIPANTMPMTGDRALSPGQWLNAKVADAHAPIYDEVFMATGDADKASDVYGLTRIDPRSAASHSIVTGVMPGSAIRAPIDSTFKEIDSYVLHLPGEKQQLFNEFAIANAEMQNRVVATMKQLEIDPENPNAPVEYATKRAAQIDADAVKIRDKIAKAERGEGEKQYAPAQTRKFVQMLRQDLDDLTEELKFWNSYGQSDSVVDASGTTWKIAGKNSIFSENVSLDEQLTFLDAIGAKRIETGLAVGSKQTKLLTPIEDKFVLASENQIWNTIKKGKADPQVMEAVRRYSKLSDTLLDYMVEQGRLSSAVAKLWRRNSTLDGTALYMHGREATDAPLTAIARLKHVLGWNTPEAVEATTPMIKRFLDSAKGIAKRAKNELKSEGERLIREKKSFEDTLAAPLRRQAYDEVKGITNPMNPMLAMESYIASVIEHVTQNSARLRAFKELSKDVTPKIVAESLDDAGIVARYAEIDPQTGKVIEGSIDKSMENAIRKRAGTGNIEDIKRSQMVPVYENGVQVLYYVPSKTIQHAVSFHPNVTTGLNTIGAMMKNLYQLGTTRNIFFAIPQAFYSTMLQMVNAPARGLIYTPLDAIKGIKEMLVVGIANETADHIDRLTATVPLFRDMKFLSKFKDHMRETVRKSLMMEIMSSTGGVASSTVIDTVTRVARTADQWNGALQMTDHGAIYGTMRGVARYFSILNRAIQDGPLVGLQMKAMQKDLKKNYASIAKPDELYGTKIKYGPTGLKRTDGTPLLAHYQNGQVKIDVEALKAKFRSGEWRRDDDGFFKNVPKTFDNEDDFVEFVLQHELAHSRQGVVSEYPSVAAREDEANVLASMVRNKARDQSSQRANVVGKQIGGDYLAQGSSESIRGIRAWVPFSGAAIQGMRAFGAAMKKDPKATLAAISTVVVVPHIAELAFLYTMASEEQREAFWKQSDSTRVSNVMIPNPDGKTFTQAPVEPLMRVFRAITIEAIDGMTDASNAYRPYSVDNASGADVETGQFMHAFITGAASVLNLPPPPIVQAGLAASGLQGVMGVDPNSDSYMGGIRPLAGQQVTAMGRDQTSMPDGVLSKNVEGIIVALTGFLGSVALSTFNQFNIDIESGLEERTGRALGEAGSKLASYSRVGQLFGLDDTVRFTRASHLDRELRPMVRGLKAAQAIAQNAVNGGMLPGGVMPAGNAPLGPEEYEQVQAAVNAAALGQNPRFMEAGTKIATAFKQLSIISASDRAQPDTVGMLPWLKAGEPYTRELKHRAQQELTTIINQERVMQLFMMKQHEELTGVSYADYAGKSPPIRLDSPFAQPSASYEEEATYTPTPEAPPSQ